MRSDHGGFEGLKQGENSFHFQDYFYRKSLHFVFNTEHSCTINTDPAALQGTKLTMLLIRTCNRN